MGASLSNLRAAMAGPFDLIVKKNNNFRASFWVAFTWLPSSEFSHQALLDGGKVETSSDQRNSVLA